MTGSTLWSLGTTCLTGIGLLWDARSWQVEEQSLGNASEGKKRNKAGTQSRWDVGHGGFMEDIVWWVLHQRPLIPHLCLRERTLHWE